MLGDVKSVDPLKLYLAVRKKGGYQSVTENVLWDLVAEEIGLDRSLGCSLKLNYIEYLDILETKFQNKAQNKESKECVTNTSMKSIDPLKVYLAVRKKGGYESVTKNGLWDLVAEEIGLSRGLGCTLELNYVQYLAILEKQFQNKESKDVNNTSLVSYDQSVCVSNRKRKRECNVSMLHWVLEVGKNPCNLGVERLPESSKWKCYGSEKIWKQVLLAREDMILKLNGDFSNTIWKTKQKMHPLMYDDYTGSHSVRSSRRTIQAKQSQPRLCFDSSSDTHSDSDYHFNKDSSPFSADSVLNLFGDEHKCVRVSPLYQANLPEYTEETYVSDTKWLGECVWPLDNGNSNKCPQIKEKVQDLCKCRNPGSDQCVRFHIGIEKKRLKLELGPAFDYWEFDKMGQQVSLSWTDEEEKRFQGIIESNPHSEGVCFWNEMFKSFPGKSREDLVSYYFNVFVLQRRGLQNRSVEKDIDSDGEESECGPLTTGFGRVVVSSPDSIFHSPKKAPYKNYS